MYKTRNKTQKTSNLPKCNKTRGMRSCDFLTIEIYNALLYEIKNIVT